MWLLPSSHLDEQSLEKSHGGAGVVSNERARRVLLLQKSWLSPKIPRKVTFIPLLFFYIAGQQVDRNRASGLQQPCQPRPPRRHGQSNGEIGRHHDEVPEQP